MHALNIEFETIFEFHRNQHILALVPLVQDKSKIINKGTEQNYREIIDIFHTALMCTDFTISQFHKG